MRYKLTKKDFNTVFNFALKYHLDPSKSSSGRTSGALRGLGAVLDSFVHGKLVEIGVADILSSFLRGPKKFELDFDIKPNNQVNEDPDIVGIAEGAELRKPRNFIEIKHISKDDKWIGVTQEQFKTMTKGIERNKVYIIGAYIENITQGINKKQSDLLGVYLKAKFGGDLFEEFSKLKDKIYVNIDFAISGSELKSVGRQFNKGSYMYETEIFQEIGKNNRRDIESGKIKVIKRITNSTLELYQYDKSETSLPIPKFFGPLKLKGSVDVYEKNNEKTKKRFIKCLTPVVVESKILGRFHLNKGNLYQYNLNTMGMNPVLTRNNIWIAKRNIKYLQKNKLIKPTIQRLKKIAHEA